MCYIILIYLNPQCASIYATTPISIQSSLLDRTTKLLACRQRCTCAQSAESYVNILRGMLTTMTRGEDRKNAPALT